MKILVVSVEPLHTVGKVVLSTWPIKFDPPDPPMLLPLKGSPLSRVLPKGGMHGGLFSKSKDANDGASKSWHQPHEFD